MRLLARLLCLFLAAALPSCETFFNGFSIVPPPEAARPPTVVDTAAELAHPQVGDPEITALLPNLPRSTVNLVRVRDRVEPHLHENSEETVYVIEGEGDLLLDREWRRVKAGALIHIPKGVAHAFVNKAPGGTTALSTFTPPLVEGDRVPLETEKR